MNGKLFIPFIAVCVIVALAAEKCATSRPTTTPDNTSLKEERKEHLAKADEGKAVHDTLWIEKIKEKTKLKEVVKFVAVADSAEIKRLFDSLVKSDRNAVTFYFEKESYKKQSEISDSIHKVDSGTIFHLTAAVLISDTIHRNDSLEAVRLRKQVQKERNGKRLWQCIAIGLGTLLIIK